MRKLMAIRLVNVVRKLLLLVTKSLAFVIFPEMAAPISWAPGIFALSSS